jgi:hypothetical protein
LAEDFIRNLCRFPGSFPGFLSPELSERGLGIHLPGR